MLSNNYLFTNFIEEFYRDNGYAPSLAQVGTAVGMSSRSLFKGRSGSLRKMGG
ncbi:MAG: hypothetical protein ABF449_12580 [Ethanoligenens sp.]